MQRLLTARGFDHRRSGRGARQPHPGSHPRLPEGAGLPVDGFASATLLEQLRQDGAKHAQAAPAVN
jgi:hypothetical protein